MKNCKALLTSLLLAWSYLSIAQTTQSSNFSMDADGWTIYNQSTGSFSPAVYNSTGGNPGGYITDGGTPVGPIILYAQAPAKFLGNFSLAYNQKLTFDLRTSFPGTDNVNGDVVITSSGNPPLYYQLPTKPGASFTSYAITFNETFAGWHANSPGGAAPTQVEMKKALSNITSLRIRTKYTTSNTTTATGSVDNVVLNVASIGSPPIISSFSPLSALPNTNITINGSNFNTTPAQNIVYFGGVKASIVNASATQLIVKAPVSAPYSKITVVNLGSGLQGTSIQSFSLLFDNNKDFGGRIIPATMERGKTVLQAGGENGNSSGGMDKGDFDGDGWIDLITTETSANKIFAYRNLGTGTISTAGFSTAITLPSFASIPGGITGLAQIAVADVDSDGKLDVTASVSSNLNLGTSFIAVFRNISTTGNVLFAAPLYFSLPYYAALTLASGDIDGDGRIDFMTTSGSAPSNLWISQNQSTPGNIDFAYGIVSGPASAGYSDIAIGDLNNDGRPEIIATGAGITIYTNNSTPGTVSLFNPFTIPNPVSGAHIAAADLDADNRLDLVWGFNTPSIYFAKNNFSGSLGPASFGANFSVASTKLSSHNDFTISDINADGKPDIIISGARDLGIMQNSGTAGNLNATSFPAPILFQGSPSGSLLNAIAPTIADLDGDNKPEVSFAYTVAGTFTTERGIFIFHNESFAVPSVTGLSPASSAAGTSISLTGNLMYTYNTAPTIRLSNLLLPISGTPTNTLTVATPFLGTISSNMLVTNHGLTGVSNYFNETFATGRLITSTSFGPSVDFTLSINIRDGLEIADFDDDGKDDAYVVDNGSTGKIFRNTATPGATITAASLTLAPTTVTGSSKIAAFDIDGDGKIDINSGAGLLQNKSTAGNVSFFPSVTSAAANFLDASIADFNQDGKLDMATTVNASSNILVYENHSSKGTFLSVSNFETFSAAISFTKNGTNGDVVAQDFDGDGYPDVVASNESTNNFTFLLNTKVNGPITTASFATPVTFSAGTANLPNGITAKDFDGDGKIDFAVTFQNLSFVSVYRNISTPGNMNFSSPVTFPCPTQGYDIGSQDLDGDGKAEIVVIHKTPSSFTILQNKSTSGNLSFGTAVNVPIAKTPLGINFSDINADGKPDILIMGSVPVGAGLVDALMVFENKITSVVLTITQQPSDASVCSGATATFTTAASGTTNITYQWQYATTSTGTFTDIANGTGYSNATTATLSVNTTGNFGAGFYRCKINGDFVATQFTNVKQLTVTVVTPPTTTPGSGCVNSSVTVTASGGTNGQYRWYTAATGATQIAGQINNTYTTPALSTANTYTYYVSINNGTCESIRTPVIVTITNCSATNVPPVIASANLITFIGGKIDIDLSLLISDPDSNVDLNTISIVSLPLSGVTPLLKTDHHLILDYSTAIFSGIDKFTIKVCDTQLACTTKDFSVEVSGDIVIFNAVSPNGDGKNDVFLIQNIEALPSTSKNKVSIFNRWGDEVFVIDNYNNTDRVFTGVSKSGADLPTGIYYYKIEFTGGRKEEDGFLSLKR